MNQVQTLQFKVNNMSITQRKTSFARFKAKEKSIYVIALIDTGNLVHSAIASGSFWESRGGKISSPMDQRVGTAGRGSK